LGEGSRHIRKEGILFQQILLTDGLPTVSLALGQVTQVEDVIGQPDLVGPATEDRGRGPGIVA
jgi:hypothetical protein